MELWRHAWRNGFAKVIPRPGLVALAAALRDDAPELLQEVTTSPPPIPGCDHVPCTGGCAISLAGWRGNGLETVADVEAAFTESCFKADQLLGGPAECRHFMDWFDDTPRDEMRRALLPEVELALA